MVSWWIFKQRVKHFRNVYIKPAFVSVMLDRTPWTKLLIHALHLEALFRCVTIFVFNRGAITGKLTFSTLWYVDRYPVALLSLWPMFFHAAWGEAQDRDPSLYFSTRWYRMKNGDCLKPGESPLIHFLLKGYERGLETHPLFYPCTASVKPPMLKSINKRLMTRCKASWGLATPQWMLRLGENRVLAPGEDLWTALSSRSFVEFEPQPVRADVWCNEHGQQVLRQRRPEYVRLPDPVLSVNDQGKPPPRLCKVGIKPYVSEPGPVYAIGGTTLFIAQDGAQCFDSLEAANRCDNAFLISSIFPYGNNSLLISVQVAKSRINEAILLTHDIENNYYHWIVEALPRLLLVLDEPKYSGFPILLTEGLHPNMIRSVQLLAPNRRIIFLPKQVAIRVNNAIYPSCVNISFEPRHGWPKNAHFRTDVNTLARLAERLSACVPPPDDPLPSRIYITRKGYLRNLGNASRIEEYLTSRGFALIDPGGLSFDRQIQLFRNANLMIVPSGSAATNALFATKGSTVCTLHPAHSQRCVFTWQTVACASGANYCCIFGDPVSNANTSDGQSFFHRGFSIRLELIKTFLNAVRQK